MIKDMDCMDWFSVTLFSISFTAIVTTTLYMINDRNLMSKNIEQAISKGVDPLSVKCAYTTTPDAICITYAMKK
jgi:hypothetical protein